MAKTSGVLEEAVAAMQSAIDEVVPPEAQTHLMAAQRELILAMAITVDFHTRPKPRKSVSGTKKAGNRKSKASKNKPQRIRLD
jgi:hypothetical protein